MYHLLSDSNITYGTSVGGITTSRVGVVTITTDGNVEFVGVVTGYSFSGDISGNLTGNVTGTCNWCTCDFLDTIKTISRSTNVTPHHIC